MNQPALDVNGAIVNYPAANNNSALFNFKQTKKTGKTEKNGTKSITTKL